MTLISEIEDFLRENGAIKVGFTTLKTLEGGPPSTDLKYLLPEAKSAVTFALPLNKDYIRDYLSKKNWKNHFKDNVHTNRKAQDLADEVGAILKNKGFKSKSPPRAGAHISSVQMGKDRTTEAQYREEIPDWRIKLYPVLSHKYLAVRSGVASFGYSGTVGIKNVGAAIILGTAVTSASFEPTDPIPQEDNFCDNCKICQASCVSGLVKRREECTIKMGGIDFTYRTPLSLLRCQLVCGGFSGLHKSGKWSTWSPGRYQIPDADKEMKLRFLINAYTNYLKWPKITSPEYTTRLRVRLTCAMCQLVCFGNRKETSQNYRALINSGCVIQKENGELVILPPDEAKEVFENMNPEHRKLYYYQGKKKLRVKTTL
ncbi:MAG: epoxyqueuosine reductase [Candidatus Helarchaeota archaeon]|nr:epoxyqueuosine reductase [Candidatus Helarchaeota archaeon]